MKEEYLYYCPKCGKEEWEESSWNAPICLNHEGKGYMMRKRYHPSHHEEPAAIPITRRAENE